MSKKRLLIVHEDPCVSNFLIQFIETPNTIPQIASNYNEVVKAMAWTKFDVIITNLTINGNFTYRYLESLREKAPLASIIVISEMTQLGKNHILKMGANDFVSLPLDIWNFTKKIDTLLCA